jgi:hypothetical protein
MKSFASTISLLYSCDLFRAASDRTAELRW